MPKKIYIVDLTKEERAYLLDFIKSGKRSARKLNRARILLLADEGKAILLSTHSEAQLDGLADRAITLEVERPAGACRIFVACR